MYNKILLPILVSLLAGCTTRSISDSEYRGNENWGEHTNLSYKGELSEFDILGVAYNQDATEANISKALEATSPVSIKRGDKLLMIQSGANLPDYAMLDEAGRDFSVAPFSGIPPNDRTSLSSSLRLRAAQGGYRYLFCYWGVLESARKDNAGRIISWVPIAGMFIQDQKQEMRIRLKGILLDVGTGKWRMFNPLSDTSSRYSSLYSAARNDQELVNELKSSGYKALIDALVKN